MKQTRRMRYCARMTDLHAISRELETLWHGDLPLAAAMDIRVASYDGTSLTLRAPLDRNRNPHATAFAGSLYGLCVLAGWGRIWLALRERGLQAHIVAADANIQYRRAVAEEIHCSCTAEPSTFEDGLADVAAGGKARFLLTCVIDAHGKRAVTFSATYAVHAIRAE